MTLLQSVTARMNRIQVLHQTNEALTLIFLLFGVLGVLMQTWGVSILTQKINLVYILFLGLSIRSA